MMAPKPSRFFVQYQDPRKWTVELQHSAIELTLTCEDAATLQQARTLAAARSKALATHVQIYERVDFRRATPQAPYSFGEQYIGDAEGSR